MKNIEATIGRVLPPGILKQHEYSMHDSDRHKCPNCDYQATKSYNLRIHVKSIHEGQKYDCPQCEYQATTPGDLKNMNTQFTMALNMPVPVVITKPLSHPILEDI